MPRVARSLEPGKLYHVISRFIDGRFELDDELRAIVLDRSERVFTRSDWTLLTYGLMSSHIHWAVLAGKCPSSEWTRPLNNSIARAIQAARRRQGQAFGAVFAGRPTEVIIEDSATALLAYVHNNPVRAGVVASAEQSRWTGHRAMIGLDQASGGADIPRALEVAGFGTDQKGRAAFHDFVLARARATDLGTRPIAPVRSAVRAAARLPLELRGPRFAGGRAGYEVIAHPETHRWAPMTIDARSLIDAAARRLRVPVELIYARDRSRPAVTTRRLALLVGRLAGQRLSTVAAALGLSTSAACDLIATIDARHPLYADARAILQELPGT